jgi:hypothetical protein
MEFVTPDYDVSDDELVQEAQQAAQKRVDDHRRFERLSGRILRASQEHGYGSVEHMEAKAERAEAFPRTLFPAGVPALPSGNDWVLAGVTVEQEDLPALLPDEEALLAEAGE